jgi:hypothetical protein
VNGWNHHVPGKPKDGYDADVDLRAKMQLPALLARANTLFYKRFARIE